MRIASKETGTTSATATSCSKPTTECAAVTDCPSAPNIRLAATNAACIAFVPGDPDRRLRRGHAAEHLAAELADLWLLPCEPLLRRTRGSARQRGLRQSDRRRNVAGAFRASGSVPTRVTLVDDVYTT